MIACLDVRNGQVVKGMRFPDHEVVSDILELAMRYRDEGRMSSSFPSGARTGGSVRRGWPIWECGWSHCSERRVVYAVELSTQ